MSQSKVASMAAFFWCLAWLAGCGSEDDTWHGCFADLMTDRNNCGACDHECSDDNMCLEGACVADRQWALWPVPELPLSPDNYEIEDRIVTDRTTNLTWERYVASGEWSYAQAEDYCEQLELEGGGWRVPTRMELVSIVDYTRVLPAVEPTVFPETPSGEFWHQSWRRRADPFEPCPSIARCQLHFAEGTHHYFGPSGDEPYDRMVRTHVRCVRGGTPPAPMEEHYEINEDTVLDTQTQLMWQREAAQRLPSAGAISLGEVSGLAEAQDWCRQSETGGFEDWRVPSITELQTLFVPYEASKPGAEETVKPLDHEAFPEDSEAVDAAGSYTSSTIWAGSEDGDRPWGADFDPPSLQHGASVRVRCVRDTRND